MCGVVGMLYIIYTGAHLTSNVQSLRSATSCMVLPMIIIPSTVLSVLLRYSSFMCLPFFLKSLPINAYSLTWSLTDSKRAPVRSTQRYTTLRISPTGWRRSPRKCNLLTTRRRTLHSCLAGNGPCEVDQVAYRLTAAHSHILDLGSRLVCARRRVESGAVIIGC